MAPEKLERLKLMLVGGLLGIGLPFLIAGMALQVTGSKLAIEIVRK